MGYIALNQELTKDLSWFSQYFPTTNGVYMIHDGDRTPIHLYVDACSTGGGITGSQAYHVRLPDHVLSPDHPIWYPKAANAVVDVHS